MANFESRFLTAAPDQLCQSERSLGMTELDLGKTEFGAISLAPDTHQSHSHLDL
jgi:hypothetical protein